MDQFLRKDHLLRCWGWLSLPNWIGALTLSLLLKLLPRKLEPWFLLWSFFLLRLLSISINLPHGHVWNTVVMTGMILLVATWNYWISYKNGYAGLLVLHLLPLWTIGSLLKCRSLYHRHYFGRSLSELAELAPLPYFQGRSTCYSDKVHNFSVTIPTIMFTIFWESDVLPNFPFTTSEMMHNYYL